MWYRTNAPTNPNSPSLLKEPKMPMILSTTDISGQNGITAPLKSTSKTTPSAINPTPVVVRVLTQLFIVFKKSIIILINYTKQNCLDLKGTDHKYRFEIKKGHLRALYKQNN